MIPNSKFNRYVVFQDFLNQVMQTKRVARYSKHMKAMPGSFVIIWIICLLMLTSI